MLLMTAGSKVYISHWLQVHTQGMQVAKQTSSQGYAFRKKTKAPGNGHKSSMQFMLKLGFMFYVFLNMPDTYPGLQELGPSLYQRISTCARRKQKHIGEERNGRLEETYIECKTNHKPAGIQRINQITRNLL